MLLLTLHFQINRLGDVDSTPSFVDASQAGQQPAVINESSLMDESPVPQVVQLVFEVTYMVVLKGSSKGADVICDSNGYYCTLNSLTAVSRGSGYKFFVTMYHQPGIRTEHYMQNGAISRGPG